MERNVSMRLRFRDLAVVCAGAGLTLRVPCAQAVPISDKSRGEKAERVTISAEDLRADAALLRECLETIHPGLYRYNTRESLDGHFAALDRAFSEGLTRPQAFVALARFTATLRCGHTFPNPYNQGDAVLSELTAGQNRLPFHFRWIDRRMVVTEALGGGGALPRGTEVLSIAGVPAGVILDALLPLTRADGGNDAKRISQLELTGQDRYEAFDLYFPLVFPLVPERLALEIRLPRSEGPSEVEVAAQSDADRETAFRRRSEDDRRAAGGEDAPLWRLSALPSGAGYLAMPTWVAYRTKWDWNKSIQDIFDDLIARDVKHLVIDLRGNEGGSAVGDEILARLVSAPTPRSENDRYVRYRKTPAKLDPLLDTWDDSFRDRSAETVGPLDLADRFPGLAAGHTGGFFRLRDPGAAGDPAEETIAPRGRRYAGRVFVLIDAANSSATFEFASKVRRLGLATLVGQPTGGNQRGINGGAFFFLRLPKSGLEVDLPQIAQFPRAGLSKPRDDDGIAPDVLVPRRVADIVAGRDAEVESVEALIRETR